MACANATAPIDISSHTSKLCTLKCDYKFRYPYSSPLSVSHALDHLRITIIDANKMQPQVVYNGGNYILQEMNLYTPSIHTYGGTLADAEIILQHQNVLGAGVLMVCIPIMRQDSTNDSVSFFDAIVVETKKTANNVGSQTLVVVPKNVTLDSALIPMKPFFSYTGTSLYGGSTELCNSQVDYVVFTSANNGYATISTSAYNSLSKLIKPHAYSIVTTNAPSIFYNSTGPISLTAYKDDNIWIDCQPTGASGEVIVPNTLTSSQLFNYSKPAKAILRSPLVQIIVGCLLIYFIMRAGKFIFTKFFVKDLKNLQGLRDEINPGAARAVAEASMPMQAPGMMGMPGMGMGMPGMGMGMPGMGMGMGMGMPGMGMGMGMPGMGMGMGMPGMGMGMGNRGMGMGMPGRGMGMNRY
jgi:carbonic anhydrase